MSLRHRLATEDDLDQLVSLTTAYRHRLAEWSPVWWNLATAADQLHPLWLKHLVQTDGPVVRVVSENDGEPLGCAVSNPQPASWFVDDVAVIDDARWPDVGSALLNAIAERPALTCVPTAHAARAHSSEAAGLRAVSSYWIRATRPEEARTEPLWGDRPLPTAPPHTFGAPLNPGADGALVFALGDGVVIGSPSLTAPPVYEPGGTVAVIDRVVGSDRSALLETALGVARERGDVLLNVVAATDDVELQVVLAQVGFKRTVDVYAWP